MSKGKDDKEGKIDVFSKSFDPLAALYSSNIPVPCTSAPIFDNVARFLDTGEKVKVKETKEKSVKKEGIKRPDDFMILSADGEKNVISRMMNADGPLAVVKDCMERQIKVKVFTRNQSGSRGYVIGSVVAFDYLWNLAMENVTEVWRRKIKKKTPLRIGEKLVNTQPGSSKRMMAPVVHVTRLDRKMELCQRHVKKLLMRGEHVISISIENY